MKEISNEEQKKILFLISSIGGGGAERVACRLVSEFSKRHKVYLMYFNKKEKEYPIGKNVTKIPFILDNKKSSCPQTESDRKGETLNQRTIRINEIEKIRRSKNIDITISFLLWPNIYNAFSEGGTKKILSERNDPEAKGEDYFKNMISAYEKADIVVFQTEYTLNKFPENIKKKGIIIPNPINISCQSEPSITKKKIVSVGRLVPQKNHALLIRAFSVFIKTHSDYNLYIYGIGSLLDQLKIIAQENNIYEFVHFEGFCEDIHERIKDAEQFVFSSNFEGMPNALMEAMMMGLPCISTDCSGVREIITNEVNGLLVPIEDVSSLARAMCRLSDDKMLQDRLGKAAKRKSEMWKTENIIQKWEELF